jgi:cystathionine gamma-synthase
VSLATGRDITACSDASPVARFTAPAATGSAKYLSQMRLETLAVHGGQIEDGPDVAPSIHLTTTFERDSELALSTPASYVREDHENQRQAERGLAAIEGGEQALLYGSGVAAAAALLEALPSGSHVVFCRDLYHGIRALGLERLPRWGMSASFVDVRNPAEVAAAFRPESKLLWLETPSNPLIDVCDLAELSAIARAHGAATVVDNTFATPVIQRPLALGCDVTLHSATKYIGGHSDVQGGALVFAKASEWSAEARKLRKVLGAVASPFNAWLIHRGLRTLPCRVEAHSRGALAVAKAFESHAGIERVHYPGLASDPGHAVASKQMLGGFGGMLSIRVKGGEKAARKVAGAVKLFTRATSLGGVESLIEHRYSAEGEHSTAPPDLLRLSIGLEHPDDLIADLEQALA